LEGRWVTNISVSFFNNGLGNNLETRTKFRIAVREECDLQRGHWISDSQRELAIYRHLRRFVPEIETLVSMNETEKAFLTMDRLLDQLRCLDKAVEDREPVRSLLLYARLRIGALESPQYFNAAPKEVWIVMIRHLFDAAWICFLAIALGGFKTRIFLRLAELRLRTGQQIGHIYRDLDIGVLGLLPLELEDDDDAWADSWPRRKLEDSIPGFGQWATAF